MEVLTKTDVIDCLKYHVINESRIAFVQQPHQWKLIFLENSFKQITYFSPQPTNIQHKFNLSLYCGKLLFIK